MSKGEKMNTSNNVAKIGQAIMSTDKKTLTVAIPFTSALYSDLNAYDSVLSEFASHTSALSANALRQAIERNLSACLTRSQRSEIVKRFDVTYSAIVSKCEALKTAITLSLIHVTDKKFNIVLTANKSIDAHYTIAHLFKDQVKHTARGKDVIELQHSDLYTFATLQQLNVKQVLKGAIV